jgi:hypothetical protein
LDRYAYTSDTPLKQAIFRQLSPKDNLCVWIDATVSYLGFAPTSALFPAAVVAVLHPIVALEVGPALISGLVALGWLTEDEKVDKGAIVGSLTQLAERALRVNVTPSAGSQGHVCFPCSLQATAVDTLINLGWLAVEHANNINEIAKSFRRFAGRALYLARQEGKLS